jgi:Adenylate cyclase regulatory domain
MNELSASELADLAGVTKAEVERMVDLGVLVARHGAAPFLASDVQKLRLATACEQAGLPMDGIAAAIRAGRLSFVFLEAYQYQRYQRYAARSSRTYRQVSQETGVRLELLRRTLESAGFAWSAPDDPMREDELEVVPLLRRVAATGILDLAWMTRIGRAWADGLRLAAKAESEAYHARVELPALESGMGQQQALELSAQLDPELAPLLDRAVMAIYHRQQELAWIEDQVEHVEAARWCAGQVVGRWGDVLLSGTRGGGAGGAGDGGGDPGGWPAAGPCWGGGRAGGGPGRGLLRPHREPGRQDRHPRRRRAGPGERERAQGSCARRRALRRAGGGTAQGVRPSGAAARGLPGIGDG